MTGTLSDPESGQPRRRLRGRRQVVLGVVLGLVGGWLGLTVAGTVHHEVGPLTTSMSVHLAWGGGTTIDIPPLGELDLHTHTGLLGVRATLEGVDVAEARQIVKDPQMLSGLKPVAERDIRWELEMAVTRAALASLLGGLLLSALVVRRVRATIAGGATALVALGASVAVGAATWNPAALAEPRYTGLLTSAPSVVGNAENIVNNFPVYGDQLARIVSNVSGLYSVTSHLPLLPPQGDLVRVLHVSDLHLAPQSWPLIRTVAREYHVNVVVDSGDLTDHGTAAENRYVREIRTIPAPYVWVRGNHDSAETEAAVKRTKNAVVLDGSVRKVAGLTFLGVGDPSFTPDKEVTHAGDSGLVDEAASQLAATARKAGGVDVVVFHDPGPEEDFDGVARMALFGHIHYRKVTRGKEGTWLMVEGSTGGSGLRALEPAQPAKIEMSVLYVDRTTGELRAYDDIQLGGLGLASAEITRHVVPSGDSTEQVAPQPGSEHH